MGPGIPVTGEIRYECTDKKVDFSYPAELGQPEGFRDPYGDPNGPRGYYVYTKQFCEPCFERLVEIGEMKRDDYKKIKATFLASRLTKQIIATRGRRGVVSLFCSGEELSWQETNRVEADDTAIVIAHALIQPECRNEHLDLSGFRFNAKGFGERGYKALAYSMLSA